MVILEDVACREAQHFNTLCRKPSCSCFVVATGIQRSVLLPVDLDTKPCR
jgi:hypothetical protein